MQTVKTNEKTVPKYCICGHLVVQHYTHTGCSAIVEGDNCEDHWVCGCMCVECIHRNEYEMKKLATELVDY